MTNNRSTALPISITVLFVWLLQALSVHGQHNYIIKHYTNENGLPANGIQGIELDKENGFLWVGTQAGLVRFDGRYFENFGSAKHTAPASRIAVIAKNREGTIYCVDDNFSVYRVTGNHPEWALTDTFFTEPFLIRGGSTQIRKARQIAERLRRHPRGSFLPYWIVFYDELGDSSSFTFNYWGHAYHYNAKKDTLLYLSNDLSFQHILQLDGRTYFVREDMELWEYNDSLMKLLPAPVTGMPRRNDKDLIKPQFIWKPGMKEPLLVFGQDIWKLRHSGNTRYLQPFCRGCAPAGAHIIAAQVWEEQDIIFLGSDVDGLFVVRKPFLNAIRSEATAEGGKAEYAQAETAPGIVTTATGFSFSSLGKLLPRKEADPLYPYTLYQNQGGDRWSHAKDTIIHFHHQSGRYTRIAVNDGASKMVFAETQGRVYVISDIAIAEITGDRYRLLYKLPASARGLKNSLNPDAAIEWKRGILAIATEKLVLFDTEKGKAPDTILIPGLTTKVRALFKYGEYLLIGTYGQGFYMYKNGVVKKMPSDKNGYLSHAHCFIPDEKGYCWISTNHGLFKASLQALTTAWEKDLPEIYYQYFGKEDGIFNTEFNGGCQPCAIRLSNGWLSFPTMNGVVLFDPLRPHGPPPGGQIFVDEVRIDSALHQATDDYLQALPWHTRNLRFRLVLPQFGNSENIYCSYKLQPYSEEWETQDIIQNNILQFGGLPPGSYTLYLRVRNGFEPDQFGTTVIGFRILKPWFQTWWFYLLCALGFIALIGGVVRWRTARIAKRKEELQELVTLQTQNIEAQSRQLETQLKQLQHQQLRLEEDNNIKARLIGIISHDMISPLKFMGYMSKRLRSVFPESDPSYHTAGFIANVAQELESLSVNILNWIKFHHQSVKMKPEMFDLQALVTESVEIAATLAKEKGLTFHIDVPAHTQVVQYRQAIGVIVYNLAMNAMKYTGAGSVSIKSESTTEGVLLTVMDTGAGMPPALVKKLNSNESFVAGYAVGETSKYQFGYVIVKDLLRLVDGSMKVDSVENKGTTVTLQFRIMTDGNV